MSSASCPFGTYVRILKLAATVTPFPSNASVNNRLARDFCQRGDSQRKLESAGAAALKQTERTQTTGIERPAFARRPRNSAIGKLNRVTTLLPERQRAHM